MATIVALLATVLNIGPTAPAAQGQAAALDSVIIVLDVSGSMDADSGTEPGKSRLDLAKEALNTAVTGLDPGGINLGLRTFADCRSELVVPVGPADPASFTSAVAAVETGGLTGIEAALRAAVADLPAQGERTVLLISDGEETCGGDPCSAATELLDANVRFVVNTVGFQTASTPAEAQLQCIADATGGTMTPVDNLDELLQSINQTVQTCTTSLVVCYAPEVRFHPAERYYPMDPAEFIEGSELHWVHSAEGRTRACYRDEVIDDDPEPHLIGQPVYTAQQLEFDPVLWNPRRCSRVGKRFTTTEFTRPYSAEPGNDLFDRATTDAGEVLDVEEGFELLWTDYGRINLQLEEPDNLHNDPGDGAELNVPIYAQLVDTGAERHIVYHMFYGFDPKSQVDIGDFDPTQLGDQLLAHEGDWERIIVVLGADDIPTEVRFLGHGCKGSAFEANSFVPWASRSTDGTPNSTPGHMEVVDGTHPVVYVAEGSHASYSYLRGTGEPACLTDSGQPSGSADQTKFDAATSVVWRPWTDGNVVDPQSQCWYGFGGAWGRGGNLDFGIGAPINLPGPLNLGELRTHDTGPAGPHYNVDFLPEGNACTDRRIVISGPDRGSWAERMSVTITGYEPGTSVVVSLASVERAVAVGAVGGDGSATIGFAIPEGFSPGGHRIIVRSQATGDILAVDHLNVVVPDDCLAPGPNPAGDDDGDNVGNECDPFPNDGPTGDFDGDGVINFFDNCPRVPNPDQAAKGRASVGRTCDIDVGHNPAAALLAEFNGQPVPAAPQATATPIPRLDYEPPTNPPPDPTGAYGFGSDPSPIVPAGTVEPIVHALEPTPVARSIPVPAAPQPAGTPGDLSAPIIANTGSESATLMMIGMALIGCGSYYLGLERVRRFWRVRRRS